jgi:hypothetical protein
MTLQTGKDAMVTHPLSTVYGSYVIEFDGAAQFVTADPSVLFEQLEIVEFTDAYMVKVILLSSENWIRDDITFFVWEAMAEHYAGTTNIPSDWDEWTETIGHADLGFIQFGYDEFNPNAERARRKAGDEKRAARLAKLNRPDPDAVCVRSVA